MSVRRWSDGWGRPGGIARALVVLLVFLNLACGLPSPAPATPDVRPTLAAEGATPTATLIPSATPSPVATFTPTPLPSPTPTAVVDPGLSLEGVTLSPWPLYGGDRLSVRVVPVLPEGLLSETRDRLAVTLDLADGTSVTSEVVASGLTGIPQARFIWVATVPTATSTLPLTLTLELPSSVAGGRSGADQVRLDVPVRPREALPPPELQAAWAVTETEGLSLHYLVGSAAERDLDAVLLEARSAYTDVSARLGGAETPVAIYLLDRVIGQGGYASSDWVAISYVDRRYAPTSLGLVLRHELTHRLDGAIGCDGASSMIREGLAVYLAGGHYRPEPLRGKARVLLATPRYIPLATLAEGFYAHQHEVAYLEAGAVLQYVAEQFGWEEVAALCEAVSSAEGTDFARWEAGLDVLGIADSATFERRWQAWLLESPADARQTVLFELEWRLMEAMRTYQEVYDPTAHFLKGILFSPAEGERLELVADFVRHPREAEPIGFELVLAMAQEALAQHDSVLLEMLVDDLVTALADGPVAGGFVEDGVAIASAALARGWEPARLVLEGSDSYLVWAVDRGEWPQQMAFAVRRDDGRWDIAELRLSD